MANQSSDAAAVSERQSTVAPWRALDRRAPSTFSLGGGLLVASVVVPVVLKPVTGLAWLSGLLLVGLAVLALAAGLLGLYPAVGDRAPWLGRIGGLSATVAGGAALGLLGMVGTAMVVVARWVALPKPMGLFGALAIAMASGLALGFVALGAAGRRSDGLGSTPTRLLVAGGAVLLVPVVGELLRAAIGVGPPPWMLFPALGAVALDALAVGYSLRSGTGAP